MAEKPKIVFRIAGPDDAATLARFQIRAWSENYADFLPRWTLDAVSVEDRAEAWRMILRHPERCSDTEVVIAETEDGGEIAGFGAAGRQRSTRLARLGYGGEISAIYVDTALQAHGLGRRLLARLFARLVRLGQRKASLWVIRDNTKARGFAEAMGAELLDPGAGGRHHALDDVAYGWQRLDRLGPRPVPARELSGTSRADIGRRPVSLAPFERAVSRETIGRES